MPHDWTYLTEATSFTNNEVRAVFRSTPASGWMEWHPNYGVWIEVTPDGLHRLQEAMQMSDAMLRVKPGSSALVNRVDEATGLAAAKALKPYPGPVVSGEVLKTMARGVLNGRSFESLGIADTTLNRLRFSGLEDDYHFLPKGEEWIVVDPAGAILVFGGEWSSVREHIWRQGDCEWRAKIERTRSGRSAKDIPSPDLIEPWATS